MNDVVSRAKDFLTSYDGPPVRIMEVCGTHTHENFRLGVRSLLPDRVTLISGPGCPVCVTPVDYIDEAVWLALEQGVTVTTFGDLIRVPGSRMSLAEARALGGRVRIVYSPGDALDYAGRHPEEEVVFLAVGFETTIPGSCIALKEAEEAGISNFSLLTALKTMPRAYEALKGSADAFLYPGHVHAVTGTRLLEDMVGEGVSGVVAGFTARELLTAFAIILRRFPEGRPFFVNAYPRVVTREGSPAGVRLIEEWLKPCDAEWRGIGLIPGSGLTLVSRAQAYDARLKYRMPVIRGRANPACRCGEILKGVCLPGDCPLFGKVCTPGHPVGACMVSGEGTCSAYYHYGNDGY